MPKHIFLTGEKQVGKSTLINKVLDALDITPTGFRTLPLWIDGTRKGCYFHSLAPLSDPFQNDTPAVLRLGQREHQVLSFVFEGLGVMALAESAKQEASVLLMDELGKAEKDCMLFDMAVRQCFEGRKPILGVLQRGEYPIKAMIMDRADTQIITVTPENRDALYEEVLALVKKAMEC